MKLKTMALATIILFLVISGCTGASTTTAEPTKVPAPTPPGHMPTPDPDVEKCNNSHCQYYKP